MISFKPVKLPRQNDLCVKFRADSFVVSFGDAEKFYEADGKGAERYLVWLQEKLARDANSVVHVFDGAQIIGQIELGRLRDDPSRGYVNLYYLIPEKRGLGFGKDLDRYAVEYFKALGLKAIRLSVSPSNTRALAYYKKMGWIDLGPRDGHPEVHFMEKSIV